MLLYCCSLATVISHSTRHFLPFPLNCYLDTSAYDQQFLHISAALLFALVDSRKVTTTTACGGDQKVRRRR